ncbi:MAG: hypothetical protein FJ104_14440 [Deltaproteobacteria bacterium]|nr:hypothetical protein [Deltaproteobacteria bacterium]
MSAVAVELAQDPPGGDGREAWLRSVVRALAEATSAPIAAARLRVAATAGESPMVIDVGDLDVSALDEIERWGGAPGAGPGPRMLPPGPATPPASGCCGRAALRPR